MKKWRQYARGCNKVMYFERLYSLCILKGVYLCSLGSSPPPPPPTTATTHTPSCYALETSRAFVLSARVEFLAPHVLQKIFASSLSEKPKSKNNLTATYDLQRSRNREPLISVSPTFLCWLKYHFIYCRRNMITCLAFSGTSRVTKVTLKKVTLKRTYFRRQPDCRKYDDSKLIFWSLIPA